MKGPFKDIIAGHQVWVLEGGNNTDYLELLRKPNVRLGGFNPTLMILSELTEEQAREIGFGGYIINPATQEEELAHCKEHLIDVLTQALKAKGINVRQGQRPEVFDSVLMAGSIKLQIAWDNSPGLEHIIIEKI